MSTFLLMGFVILNGCASAFQPPTTSLARVLNLCHHNNGRTHRMNNIVLFSQDDDSVEDQRLPFFARALQKLRQKKEEEADDDIAGVFDKTDNTSVTNNHINSEAATLRALAAKTRLEAEKMDISLTLAKIEKLEGKIISEKDDKLRANLLEETQMLLNKLNGVVSIPIKEIEPNKTPSESESLSIRNDKKEKNIVQDILDGNKPLLSEDKKDAAIQGFDGLPPQLKDMMARSVGMNDGSNSTAVIEKLMKEKKLYQPENGEENFSFLANATDIEDVDVFVDLDFAELNAFVSSLLPEVTRKTPVKEEYIDTLYTDNILGKDTFIPRERKPQAIPGGYLIRGESRVKSVEGKDDGDVLIEALDKKISTSSVAGKIQVNYILDPTPPSGEEILQEVDETPVLFVTNYDMSPDTQPWVKPVVTLIGISSIEIFAIGSFALNTDIVDRISATANTMDIGSLGWLYNLSLPLALSLLATQIFHELGHLIVAVKEDIKIGSPTLIPGVQFGLTGAITPIKSSPKNIKSLFDFAIAGPLLGLAASLVLLYVGLEMTVFMDSSALEQLPSVPIVLLRSSALGGGIIDYLLGDGVLTSPDPSQMIKLHPFALAGYCGLVTNALSLLPIGNTDGGRISLAFFGRPFSRVVQGTALIGLIIAGFFGADQVDILLTYAVFCQFFQKETELPCRNEVDELDTVRGFIAIGVSLIVLLTLTPLPL